MTNVFICQPGGCNYKLWESAFNKAMIKRARIKKQISDPPFLFPFSSFLNFRGDKMVNVVYLSYIVLCLRLYKVRGDALLKDGPDDDRSPWCSLTIILSSVTLLAVICAQIRSVLSLQPLFNIKNPSHFSTVWCPKLNPTKRAGFDDIVATCWGSPEQPFCRPTWWLKAN